MVTLRTIHNTTSQETPDAPRRRCRLCNRLIVWLPTCHNQTLPFQPDPEPVKYDDGNGWAPGQFTIGGTARWVFAPITQHPPAKRRRIVSVMLLHHCGRRAA